MARPCAVRCVFLVLLAVAGPFAFTQSVPEPTPKPGTERINTLGIKLVYVPPGTFQMGSPRDEKGRHVDEDLHEVQISKGLYLGRFEVTQDQYAKVTGQNPSAFRGGNLPVESISWLEAKEFCRLLSLKEGLGGKDGKSRGGYRLPTEAEWEWACRAGSKTTYHFGPELTPERANYYSDKKNGTMAVGSFPPNAWGLHDMHGNVWEWCEDLYADYADTAKVDPNGPLKKQSFRRVVRGGGWGNDPLFCRSATRFSHEKKAHANIGFRIALPADE